MSEGTKVHGTPSSQTHALSHSFESDDAFDMAEDFEVSTLGDFSRALQGEPSSLSSIAEERNEDKRRETEPSKRMRAYRSRHSSIGNNAMERTPLRKLSSPYISFDETPDIFGLVQLNVLNVRALGVDVSEASRREWREIARWIKYEQDLEEGAERLGRPHIAPLPFHFLMRLNALIEKNGIVLLDLEGTDMAGIGREITQVMNTTGQIQPDEVYSLMEDLMLKHRLAPEREKGGFVSKLAQAQWEEPPRSLEQSPSLSSERRQQSMKPKNILLRKMAFANRSISFSFAQQPKGESDSDVGGDVESTGGRSPKLNAYRSEESIRGKGRRRSSSHLTAQMTQIPAESTIILLRGNHSRKRGAIVFARLVQAIPLNDVSSLPTPTRIIVLILAPTALEDEFVEMGRSLGTLMANMRFYETALNAAGTLDILSGLNEFLHESIILPPGDWYTHTNFHQLLPQHELEMKSKLIQKQKYKAAQKAGLQHFADSAEALVQQEQGQMDANENTDVLGSEAIGGPFIRTGKAFGGLLNDIKRRYPGYKDDFLDALNLQCVSTTIFLYFASVAHNVTFGGLLSEKTHGHIGIPETMIASTGGGVTFSLLSGQPILPVAPTAPLLLFDEILYEFLGQHKIEFLPARTWIGLWVLVISIIYVGFEGSVVVKNFTRFTQETFATLISVVFVYESFTSLINVFKEHPLHIRLNQTIIYVLQNSSRNSTDIAELDLDTVVLDKTVEQPPRLIEIRNEPNTALLSTILMFGTFFLAFTLRNMRGSELFGTRIRNTLSNFSVPLAIFIMVFVDVCAGDVYTRKIQVPRGLQPTLPSKRGWLIPPWGIDAPFDPWVPLVTILPGALVFILMSMTLQICELILSEREKLEKGNGFHLDVLIVGVINFGSGLFGLPWLSCATLMAMAHCSALTVYSTNNPPGTPPVVVRIIQERVTSLLMAILLGSSILLAPLLQYVSMSILFGVFLYMGITSLLATQFYQRILLFITPTSEHPPTIYVRRVPTWKIHLFTLIQMGCIVLLWVVKSIKAIALSFPFIIMLLVPIRISLKYIFTESELEVLDGKPKTVEKPNEKVT